MPHEDKGKLSFLIALNKQLQRAIDEGLEHAYVFGELVDEVLDLVSPTDGDSVDEMDGDDAGQGPGDGDEAEGQPPSSEDSLPAPDVRRVVRGVERARGGSDRPRAVPRGTGSRPASGLAVPVPALGQKELRGRVLEDADG